MAEKPGEKTIEMRLAEIEDKLAKLHITEEEMKAYHKVSSLLAGGAQVGMEAAVNPNVPALSPTVCTISRQRGIVPIIVPRIINECTCGPCSQMGGGGFTGGFGGFGM